MQPPPLRSTRVFIHQALCSPTTATLLWALKHSKELATIPGFMLCLVPTHLPFSTATDKGHMRCHRQGTRSTRSLQPAILNARRQVDNLIPAEEICTARQALYHVINLAFNAPTMYTIP